MDGVSAGATFRSGDACSTSPTVGAEVSDMSTVRTTLDHPRNFKRPDFSTNSVLVFDSFHNKHTFTDHIFRWHQGAVQLAMWKGWRYAVLGENWGTLFQKVTATT